jgi:uncharacterized protein (DUF2235 family)
MMMGIQRAGSDRAALRESPDAICGIWDTVSSVGWVENPLHPPYEANNPDIEIGRHAVSIDERRAFFRSHLWQLPKDPARGI